MTLAAKAAAAKAAAATLGTGGVVTLGCYVCGAFGGTEWHSLTEEVNKANATTNDYTNKLGDKSNYGLFLTGVTDTGNESWWKESYERYKADAEVTGNNALHFSTLFTHSTGNAKVTSAFSLEDDKALNKVCGEAYKKTLNTEIDFNYTTIADNTDDKHKLAADVLRYCSPLIELPVILEASTNNTPYASNTVGNQGPSKKLVKTDESKNDFFWMQQQEWFKEKGSSQLGAYFTTFFEGDNGNKQLKPGQNIRTICAEAYKKEAITSGESTNEKPKPDDVAKYCSFVRPTS